MGDQDKHLDVMLSLHRRQERTNALLTVTTVVHVHSRMGRIYMLPVTPMHKLIAPAAMKALASA